MDAGRPSEAKLARDGPSSSSGDSGAESPRGAPRCSRTGGGFESRRRRRQRLQGLHGYVARTVVTVAASAALQLEAVAEGPSPRTAGASRCPGGGTRGARRGRRGIAGASTARAAGFDGGHLQLGSANFDERIGMLWLDEDELTWARRRLQYEAKAQMSEPPHLTVLVEPDAPLRQPFPQPQQKPTTTASSSAAASSSASSSSSSSATPSSASSSASSSAAAWIASRSRSRSRSPQRGRRRPARRRRRRRPAHHRPARPLRGRARGPAARGRGGGDAVTGTLPAMGSSLSDLLAGLGGLLHSALAGAGARVKEAIQDLTVAIGDPPRRPLGENDAGSGLLWAADVAVVCLILAACLFALGFATMPREWNVGKELASGALASEDEHEELVRPISRGTRMFVAVFFPALSGGLLNFKHSLVSAHLCGL